MRKNDVEFKLTVLSQRRTALPVQSAELAKDYVNQTQADAPYFALPVAPFPTGTENEPGTSTLKIRTVTDDFDSPHLLPVTRRARRARA